MAVNGKIYDVTKGRSFYGPGKYMHGDRKIEAVDAFQMARMRTLPDAMLREVLLNIHLTRIC